MPAILTHYAFAKNNFPKEYEKYSSLVYLGAQGPDVFFFLGHLKRRENSKEITHFGHHLHNIELTDFYYCLFKYIQNRPEDEKDKLYAYLNGLLIHYCLDRNTHPYIFYRTGNIPSIEKNDPNYYMRSHVFFESNVDVLIANHMKFSKNNVKAIKNNKEDVKIISKMYKAINDELFKYDFIKEDTFYLCYLDMLSIEKLFYSPLGIKRLFYYPFRKKIQLWVQTNPVKPYHNQEIDYLNLKKNSWKYPDTGIETDDSFFDLVEKAREDLNIVNELFENKNNENLKQKINLFINNINHDGCKIGLEKSYFDFCYKLIKKVPF